MDIILHLALSFSLSVFISIHLFLSYSSFFLNRYKVRITLFLLFKLYPSVSFLYVLITLFPFVSLSSFSLISPVFLLSYLSYLLLSLFLLFSHISFCFSFSLFHSVFHLIHVHVVISQIGQSEV